MPCTGEDEEGRRGGRGECGMRRVVRQREKSVASVPCTDEDEREGGG